MISVALIGADGAGKTTIANMLLKSFQKPIRYLYMGINAESSNVALPTTQLIEFLKGHKGKRANSAETKSTSLHHRNSKGKKKWLRQIWLFVRLFNRLAEEWYRQLLSWIYRKQGYLVLYDRHFLFDFARNGFDSDQNSLPVAERIHRWCLHHFYPEPDLVIFLDAPEEVLFARKGEATLEFLKARRHSFLEQGKKTKNFVRVDTMQPVEQVYLAVAEEIARFYESRKNG